MVTWANIRKKSSFLYLDSSFPVSSVERFLPGVNLGYSSLKSSSDQLETDLTEETELRDIDLIYFRSKSPWNQSISSTLKSCFCYICPRKCDTWIFSNTLLSITILGFLLVLWRNYCLFSALGALLTWCFHSTFKDSASLFCFSFASQQNGWSTKMEVLPVLCLIMLVLLCSQLPPTSESCEFDDPRLLQNIENNHVSRSFEYHVS